MEENKNNLHKCFKKLNQRLYEISTGKIIHEFKFAESVIQYISDKGIHGLDPEDVQDQIIFITDRINSIHGKVVSEVNDLEFEESTEVTSVFGLPIIKLDAEAKRRIILGRIQKELDYYKSELDSLYNDAINRISISGTLPSQEITRLTFNLKIEEIGTLFEGLISANIIEFRDKSSSKSVHKGKLADWISKNCASKPDTPGNPGHSISASYVRNKFNLEEAKSVTLHLNNVIKRINGLNY